MKLTTTFRGPGSEIRYYTDHSNAFSIGIEGMTKIPTDNPVVGIDYSMVNSGYHIRITGVDMV